MAQDCRSLVYVTTPIFIAYADFSTLHEDLNVDIAVSGPWPYTDATPDLHHLATETMKKVIYPIPGSSSQTLYDVWQNVSGEFGILGAGSDYVPFLQKTGTASLDLGAGGSAGDPIYHYHSNYDSYHWMATFGDPGFQTHKAIGQYLALLTYHLASDAVLPLEPADYVPEFETYLGELNDTIASSNGTVDISALTNAVATFSDAAQEFNALRQEAILTNDTELLTVVNHKARDYSRGFVSQGGLPGREFYENLIFAYVSPLLEWQNSQQQSPVFSFSCAYKNHSWVPIHCTDSY